MASLAPPGYAYACRYDQSNAFPETEALNARKLCIIQSPIPNNAHTLRLVQKKLLHVTWFNLLKVLHHCVSYVLSPQRQVLLM